MTTNLFVKRAQTLRAALPILAPRPAPGVNVQMSKDVGLPVAVQPVPAAMPTQWVPPTEIPLGPKPADLETIDLRGAIRLARPPVRIGGHSTSEMGGRGERSGSLVDGR